jgi:predicted Zn finger-like uncharacterized protein
MSLITRCPACGTLFKVVPDQLRVSEGWVRCGRCEEIFDASAHLQTLPAEPAAVSVTPAPPGQQPAAVTASPAATQQAAAETALVEPSANDVPAQAIDAELPLQDAPQQESALIPARPSGTPAPLSGDTLPQPPAESVSDGAAPTTAQQAGQSPELSFMRRHSRSRWQRPLVRAALLTLALLLTLVLLLQLLVHERDRLAAVEPDARPWLARLCLLLDCELRPWRQIEAVTIDSSVFSKVRADVYRLSLTLKNTRPYDVALPAVELTLTDALDRPLLRRVLLPHELVAGAQLLHAASELQATLVLALKTNGERVAGYRLYAFYP